MKEAAARPGIHQGLRFVNPVYRMTPFIRKITIRNYKSIASCELSLENLVFLVGPNGSGKSNFLDCFRFVSDSLKTSLDHALRDRGTIKEVRRRSGGHPNHFSLRLDFNLRDGGSGHLSFRIGARKDGGFEVQNEECRIFTPSMQDHFYHVESGTVLKTSLPLLPAALPDRLFLVAASAVLLAALREASVKSQILVTSHSPDLLDNEDIPAESILAVDNEDGITRIGPMDPAGRQMLRDKLFTPGELLRQNQVAADPASLQEVKDDRQLKLFEFNGK